MQVKHGLIKIISKITNIYMERSIKNTENRKGLGKLSGEVT